MEDQMLRRVLGERGAFLFTFVMITLTILGASALVITFVWQRVRVDNSLQVDRALSTIYVNYYNSADNFVSADSYLAMAAYQREYVRPQNVRVLTGLDTQGVIGYMLNHISAGMGVNCTHCHSLENFAADMWDDPVGVANKRLAREHLYMVRDLNQEWIASLASLTSQRQPSGAQVTCATCHNGVAVPQAYPEDQDGVPDNFRLPLAENVVFSVENQGILNVNARRDISLETVQYNQNVMYHMNQSLGVGCTHCHNSRYFPSYEVPTKYYALHMLQMSQFLVSDYSDALRGQQPSCNLCHQGAAIPPGAARSADVMPASLVADD
jgi:photosynthetic reaction center cytochrome c subunit